MPRRSPYLQAAVDSPDDWRYFETRDGGWTSERVRAWQRLGWFDYADDDGEERRRTDNFVAQCKRIREERRRG